MGERRRDREIPTLFASLLMKKNFAEQRNACSMFTQDALALKQHNIYDDIVDLSLQGTYCPSK